HIRKEPDAERQRPYHITDKFDTEDQHRNDKHIPGKFGPGEMFQMVYQTVFAYSDRVIVDK
ncbi:hypothetical protein OFC17_31620, partial [Escherichia coli]|nr:hypothetical protein [Escherichia coli]